MSVTISYPSTQFKDLYGPFVNLGVHLPPKDNSPLLKMFTIEKENLFYEKGFPNCTKKKDIIFFDKKLSQFF